MNENQTTFTRDEAIKKLTEIWLEHLLNNYEELEQILCNGLVGFHQLSNSLLETKLEETFQDFVTYRVVDTFGGK